MNQSPAVLIKDIIYISGPTNSLLRIKVGAKNAPESNRFLVMDGKDLVLPPGAPGEETMLSSCSPFFEVGNV